MSKHVQRPMRRIRRAVPLQLAVVGLLAMGVAVAQPGHDDHASTDASFAANASPARDTTPPSPTPTESRSPAAHTSPSRSPQERSKSSQGGHAGPKARLLAKKAQRLADKRLDTAVPLTPETTFQIASLNLLGASHTSSGGNKPGYAAASTRMHFALAILNGAGVDVVGLQEFQSPQYQALRNISGGAWGVWPGVSHGPGPVQNSIAWRAGEWSLVEAHQYTIPYFHGNPMQMPYVKLRNSSTGAEVWFVNFHNPASTRGNAQPYRTRAMRIEAALVRRLYADGTPVILTGDANEKSEYLCGISRTTQMRSAIAPSLTCGSPPQIGIDWIFGSSTVSFSGYVRQDGGLVNRATDHPFVHATATVGGPGNG